MVHRSFSVLHRYIATIIAAVLHDVVDDASVSVDTLRKEFGDAVAHNVDRWVRACGCGRSSMDTLRKEFGDALAHGERTLHQHTCTSGFPGFSIRLSLCNKSSFPVNSSHNTHQHTKHQSTPNGTALVRPGWLPSELMPYVFLHHQSVQAEPNEPAAATWAPKWYGWLQPGALSPAKAAHRGPLVPGVGTMCKSKGRVAPHGCLDIGSLCVRPVSGSCRI